jgi:hypothetical protein
MSEGLHTNRQEINNVDSIVDVDISQRQQRLPFTITLLH